MNFSKILFLYLFVGLMQGQDACQTKQPKNDLSWQSRFKIWAATNPTILDILSSRPMTWIEGKIIADNRMRLLSYNDEFHLNWSEDSVDAKVSDPRIIALWEQQKKIIGLEKNTTLLWAGSRVSPEKIEQWGAAYSQASYTDLGTVVLNAHHSENNTVDSMDISLGHEIGHFKYNTKAAKFMGKVIGVACGALCGVAVASAAQYAIHKSDCSNEAKRFVSHSALKAVGAVIGGFIGKDQGNRIASFHAESVADACTLRALVVSGKEEFCWSEDCALRKKRGYFSTEEAFYLINQLMKAKNETKEKSS